MVPESVVTIHLKKLDRWIDQVRREDCIRSLSLWEEHDRFLRVPGGIVITSLISDKVEKSARYDRPGHAASSSAITSTFVPVPDSYFISDWEVHI